MSFLSRRFMKHWHGLRKRYENRHFDEQWLLGFRPLSEGQGAADLMQTRHLDGFTLLDPPRDRFFADPFLAREGEKIYCFFEESEIAPVFGWISLVVLNPRGEVIEPPRAVLRCDYHLSYPQIFNHGGQWYMLPETSANRTIELWRADAFPDGWRRERVLIEDIPAADATLYQNEQGWWLFAAVKLDCRKFGNKLYLWHSDDLLSGEWKPHPLNPVRENLLYDRPAGELFMANGRLIRPVQDSVKRYGGAVEFRQLDRLTAAEYAEHAVARLEFPRSSGFAGVHTVNACAGMAAIDLLRLLPKRQR
jgi:hypothetical protein